MFLFISEVRKCFPFANHALLRSVQETKHASCIVLAREPLDYSVVIPAQRGHLARDHLIDIARPASRIFRFVNHGARRNAIAPKRRACTSYTLLSGVPAACSGSGGSHE